MSNEQKTNPDIEATKNIQEAKDTALKAQQLIEEHMPGVLGSGVLLIDDQMQASCSLLNHVQEFTYTKDDGEERTISHIDIHKMLADLAVQLLCTITNASALLVVDKDTGLPNGVLEPPERNSFASVTKLDKELNRKS